MRRPISSCPTPRARLRRLSEFWAAGPVHLVFMRHFGCGCLADRWEQLEPAQARIAAAGATLVAVCQADPSARPRWPSDAAMASRCCATRSCTAYQAYGLPEGVPATITQDFPWRPGDTATADSGRPRAGAPSVRSSTTRGSCRVSSW